MVCDRTPGRLYLAAVDPGNLEGLQAKLTERYLVAAMGKTGARTTVGFAKLRSLGHQHDKLLRSTILFDIGSISSCEWRSIGWVRGRDCDFGCIRCEALIGLPSGGRLSGGRPACAHTRPGLCSVHSGSPGTTAISGCITLPAWATRASTAATFTPVAAVTVAVGARLGCGCGAVHLQEGINALTLDYITAIYPDLHADTPVGRVSVHLAVVNVGADGVEGHATFH